MPIPLQSKPVCIMINDRDDCQVSTSKKLIQCHKGEKGKQRNKAVKQIELVHCNLMGFKLKTDKGLTEEAQRTRRPISLRIKRAHW